MNNEKMREAIARLRREAERVQRDEHKYAELAYSPSADTLESIADDIDAALAEQPAQGEAAAYLADGMRFKLAPGANRARYLDFPKELGGKWVALVDATDGRHLHLTAPPAPSVPGEQSPGSAPDDERQSFGWARGWNACRAAMLAAAPEVPRG